MCWSSGLVMGRTCRSSLSASDLDASMVCEQGAFVASKRRAPPCSETGLERPEATKLAPHMSFFPRQSPKCTTSKLGGRACKRFPKYSSKDRFHGENCNKKRFSCDHIKPTEELMTVPIPQNLPLTVPQSHDDVIACVHA